MLKSLLALTILLSTVAFTQAASVAEAQVAPIFDPYWYSYQSRLPGLADKPARELEATLKKMNAAFRDASAAQSLRCSDLSIKWLGTDGADLLIQGSFSCAQRTWDDLNQETLAQDFTKLSGLSFLVLPPAGGGGGTIHN